MSTAATATTTMLRTTHNYRRQSDLAALADTHTHSHTQRQCVTINDNSVAWLALPFNPYCSYPLSSCFILDSLQGQLSLLLSALRHHLLLLTFALHLENWYGKTIFQQVTGLVTLLPPFGQPINHPPQLYWLKCWANTRRNANFAFVCHLSSVLNGRNQ